METVIRNVGDIDDRDRQALEHVLGHRLEEHQLVEIRIVNREATPIPSPEPASQNGEPRLPDWCNVYAGLSDEEIAELERTILTRADLTRSSE